MRTACAPRQRSSREAGVRSLAIAFFNSYRNPAHELAAKAHRRKPMLPDIAVCTSAEIAPEIREYRALLDRASPMPMWRRSRKRYLVELERRLGVPLFVMLSDGGITTARAASEQPIALVESGPAAGAMGAAFLCRQAGWRDVIAFDMGGTTAKISLIHDGQPASQPRARGGAPPALQEGQRPAASPAGDRADRDRRGRRQHRGARRARPARASARAAPARFRAPPATRRAARSRP